MFERAIKKCVEVVQKYKLWIAVILIWVVGGLLMYFLAPSLSRVGEMNEASFLPENSQYMQAQEILKQKFPEQVAEGQGVLVFYDPQGLSDSDLAYAQQLSHWLISPAAPSQVQKVTTFFQDPDLKEVLLSRDGQAMLMPVDFSTSSYDAVTNEAIEIIREHIEEGRPEPLTVYFTGSAAIGRDMFAAVNESTDTTTIVTIVLVILVLLLVYRSPIAMLVPLITVGLAALVARGVLGFIATGGLELASMLDALVIVLIFGAGTDYVLFMISRFREELGKSKEQKEAITTTVSRIGPVITASAGTVIIGLMGMMVAQFGMLRTNGPAMALSILIALISAWTLTPSLLFMFGRSLFWPFQKRLTASSPAKGLINWERLGKFVTKRPWLVTAVVLVALLAPYPFWLQMNSAFDVMAEVPSGMDSSLGYSVLKDHFSSGEMAPMTVVLTSEKKSWLEPASLSQLSKISEALAGVPGVQSVRWALQPTNGSSLVTFSVEEQLKTMTGSIAEMLAQIKDPEKIEQMLTQNPTQSVGIITDYLEELVLNFPEIKDQQAFISTRSMLDKWVGEIGDLLEQAKVSWQLERMATEIEGLSETTDPAQILSSSGQTDDLSLLNQYLAELGAKIPSLQEDQSYIRILDVLTELKQASEQMQDQLKVSFQLEQIADQIQSQALSLSDPQALLGQGGGDSLQALGSYLNGLAQSLPAVAGEPSFAEALLRLNNIQTLISGFMQEAQVSRQLNLISQSLENSSQVFRSPEGLQQSLPEFQNGLDQILSYLKELGEAFPSLLEDPSYRDAILQIEKMRQGLAQLLQPGAEGATMTPTQMQVLVATFAESVGSLQKDLSDLEQIFAQNGVLFLPQSIPATPEMQRGLIQLGQEFQALDLALRALAERAEGQTYLPPEYLSSSQAQAAIQLIRERFLSLSEGLRGLASFFQGTDRIFIPRSSMAEELTATSSTVQKELKEINDQMGSLAAFFQGKQAHLIPQSFLSMEPQLAQLIDRFFSADRSATQLTILLEGDPYAFGALQTAEEVRSQLNQEVSNLGPGYHGYLGGVTAMSSEAKRTVDEDFTRVQIVVVAGVFLVFILLLRSVLAPIYLALSVILSYGTTMGICTLIFQNILGYTGVNYALPIIVFVLLVALGADYNIFLMSRVREEARRTGDIREGISRASTFTGSVITSCGIILAGTFAALIFSPIPMLMQIGTAVAIGVLVDTFIVRTLLVPAIATLLGRWNWWPSRK